MSKSAIDINYVRWKSIYSKNFSNNFIDKLQIKIWKKKRSINSINIILGADPEFLFFGGGRSSILAGIFE